MYTDRQKKRTRRDTGRYADRDGEQEMCVWERVDTTKVCGFALYHRSDADVQNQDLDQRRCRHCHVGTGGTTVVPRLPRSLPAVFACGFLWTYAIFGAYISSNHGVGSRLSWRLDGLTMFAEASGAAMLGLRSCLFTVVLYYPPSSPLAHSGCLDLQP